MLPNIEQLENKIVVILLNTGREILCKLWNISIDNSFLTVENPRYVTLNASTGQANMIVMTVTSDQETVYLNTSAVLTIMEATDDVANEYNSIIAVELQNKRITETEPKSEVE